MNKAIIGGIIAAVAIGAAASAFLISSDSTMQPPTISKNEKLGLVINTPTSEITLQSLDNIFSKGSSTGIGRSNVYMFWNVVEPQKQQFNWDQYDVLMSLNKKNDLKVTLYFSIINGKTLGPFPGWMGEPSLKSISEDNLSHPYLRRKILDRVNYLPIVGIQIQESLH